MYRCWGIEFSNFKGSNQHYQTHDLGGKAGTVGKVDNGVIKIIEVGLVVRLKLMEKIEEAECEYGVWSK